MISIVFSTRKDNPSYQKHIKDTIGLKEVEILQYVNDGQYSLPEVYNKGLKEAKNDIIVFMHDDLVLEQDSKWGKKICKHFENSDYGILGKAGTTSLTESGRWWDEPHLMVGSVYHQHTDPETNKKVTWESRYSGLFHHEIIPVILIDGLFMAVHRNRIKKQFDEDFKGFHLYDLSFCIPNFLAGVKIGVVFDFKLTHKSIGMTNEEWEKNRRQFVDKWAFYTDDEGNKQLGLPISIHPDSIKIDDINIHIKNEPKVAVIIPTKSKLDLLFKCLDSFKEKSTYQNYKIYIADTGSSEEELNKIKSYIEQLPERYKLIEYNYYNFSKINNDVIKYKIDQDTELLLLCNNDIELLNDGLSIVVDEYIKHKKEVGTIGIRLHYPNKSIQHGGITIGLDKSNHILLSHRGLRSYYNYEPNTVINVFGSTGAFLLIPKDNFNVVNGFDENFQEAFEDVVLNVQQILKNKVNIFCGTAVAIHHESQSRGKGKIERESQDFNKILIPFLKDNINNNKIRKHLKLL